MSETESQEELERMNQEYLAQTQPEPTVEEFKSEIQSFKVHLAAIEEAVSQLRDRLDLEVVNRLKVFDELKKYIETLVREVGLQVGVRVVKDAFGPQPDKLVVIRTGEQK